MLDAFTIAAVNAYKERTYPEAPSLFLELGGTERGVGGEVEAAREICAAEDAASFEARRRRRRARSSRPPTCACRSRSWRARSATPAASSRSGGWRRASSATWATGTSTSASSSTPPTPRRSTGIGLGKVGYLEREHADLIPVMRGIKRLLDPNGISTGKVLPRG